MTTEDDFQAATHPDDWQTRLVFADWLEECGDPRAVGYRALGFRRLHPLFTRWWDAERRPDLPAIRLAARPRTPPRSRSRGCSQSAGPNCSPR